MPKPEPEQGESIPEWVVTFGDMMSLLLTFFVLLFSMSEIKEEQQQALIQSLRRQFGHVTASLSLVPGRSKPMNSAFSQLASMGRAYRAGTMSGGDKVPAPVGDYPPLRASRPGTRLATSGTILFPPGRSELSPQNRQILENIADTVRGKPQMIEIRGHTSPRPLDPHSPYPNHWDLAYARCYNVMEQLVQLGIDRRRILLAIAAQNEPPTAPPDPLHPELGRDRVEVSLLDKFVQQSDQPAPTTDTLP